MRVGIMGCGRVGAALAGMLEEEGNEVIVLDVSADSFHRLPPSFRGKRHVGNGIDQEVLARIGVGKADAFIAVTQGDNRNVMAAQIAKQLFNVPRVLCRIYDLIREEIYHDLGMETISPTLLGARFLKERLEKGPPDEGKE